MKPSKNKTRAKASKTPQDAPDGATGAGTSPPAENPATGQAEPRKLPPANAKARDLREKLEALAARGVNGEAVAAKVKLGRLLARFDWTAVDTRTGDLFAGVFRRANVAAPVCGFEPEDWDLANGVKWAFERLAHIPCCYRDGSLMAEADSITANRLHGIGASLAESFRSLWRQYAAVPGVNQADRGLFVAGLADGMLGEVRTGTALPQRATVSKIGKAKRKAVSAAPGLTMHPYSVAAGLGKQLRFSVPLETVSGELERTIKGEIEL